LGYSDDVIQSSITKKHIIAFLLILVIPLFLVIIANSWLFREEAIQIAKERSEEVSELFAESLNREVEDFAFYTSALLNDLVLQEHARVFTTTNDDVMKYQASQGLQGVVSWFFRFTTSIGSVFLFFEDDSYLQYSNDSSNVLTENLARSLIEQAPDDKGEVYCFDTLKIANRSRPVLTMLVHAPSDIRTTTNLKTILVSFQASLLTTAEKENGMNEYLIGRDGTILYSNDSIHVGELFDPILNKYQEDYLILSSTIPSIGWNYYQAIPYQSLTHGMGIIMRYVYLALAISVLLFLVYTRTFFSSIIRPLHSVIKRMDRVAEGDFSVQVRESGSAEFLHLERTFNSMVQRIKTLTDQLLKNQQEQSRLELEALRYRMNPHFILNTLNSMTIMAGIAKAESLKKMSKAMTKIMQQTLKDDTTLISYDQEKEYLESYIYISTIRFGNRFTFTMHIDEELKTSLLPTMLLQPLVENSILHGMRGKQGIGSIVVSAQYYDRHVILKVEDDGVGIPQEILDQLFEGPKEGKRGFNQIGLYAVKRRLNLAYPEIGDLIVESTVGRGTTVTLILPFIAGVLL
jgi:two-component system sensor histidine kinase YesM